MPSVFGLLCCLFLCFAGCVVFNLISVFVCFLLRSFWWVWFVFGLEL